MLEVLALLGCGTALLTLSDTRFESECSLELSDGTVSSEINDAELVDGCCVSVLDDMEVFSSVKFSFSDCRF